MMSSELWTRGISRAVQLENDEKDAHDAAIAMNALLRKGEFARFYDDYVHPRYQSEIRQEEFVELVRRDRGKDVVDAFATIAKALQSDEPTDKPLMRFNDRNADAYEFVLKQRANADQRPLRVELWKDKSRWKLRSFD